MYLPILDIIISAALLFVQAWGRHYPKPAVVQESHQGAILEKSLSVYIYLCSVGPNLFSLASLAASVWPPSSWPVLPEIDF